MQGSGLTASELSAVLLELDPVLRDATIRDVARLDERDDLLLFFETREPPAALHVVTGGQRARITLTHRRFRRSEFRTGPLVDRLRERLVGAVFAGVTQPKGERSCRLALTHRNGDHLELQIELFGARGLWCLTDAGRRILELSRLPQMAGREIRPGAVYVGPTPRGDRPADPASRFAAPVLQGVDAWFTEFDDALETTRLRKLLAGAIDRAARKLQHKIDGLARQREEIDKIPDLRREADMLLAYGFGQPSGATSLTVPDPDDPEQSLTFVLNPAKSIQVQADTIYKRARKLTDGASAAARRQARAESELKPVLRCRAKLEEKHDLTSLLALQVELAALGLVAPTTTTRAVPATKHRGPKKATKGYHFRQFTSSEGYPILVGRTNRENDRLTVAVARGNDLWFHVGQGYAGSHVVIRLPKGKTASLESLLDAATLAHYFSKARQATRIEVIYTQAKNVRKPKGLPPGRVTTTGTKTVLVHRDADRLQRILDTAQAP